MHTAVLLPIVVPRPPLPAPPPPWAAGVGKWQVQLLLPLSGVFSQNQQELEWGPQTLASWGVTRVSCC